MVAIAQRHARGGRVESWMLAVSWLFIAVERIESPNNKTMHAKSDLRVEHVPNDHWFRLGDLGRYPT